MQERYDRVSFRALHMFEPDENPQDNLQGGEFFPPRPVLLQELHPSVQERLVPPPTNVPPPRPPPPNFGASAASPRPAIAIPVSSPAVPQSPASPDPSESYSPTDIPTKRITPSPPLYSPDRLRCEQSYYVADKTTSLVYRTAHLTILLDHHRCLFQPPTRPCSQLQSPTALESGAGGERHPHPDP